MKKQLWILGTVMLLGFTTACGNYSEKAELTEEPVTAAEATTQEDMTWEETAEVTTTQEITTEADTDMDAENQNVDTVEETPAGESADTSDADYYAGSTNFSKSEVENFANVVKQQILNKNWSGLTENIAFPITVGDVTYTNSSEFMAADWNALLGEDFYAAIEKETCQDMFHNYQGIMLGDGQVWIAEILDASGVSQGLKVTAINKY